MKLNGFIISHKNENGFSKIIARVQELGERYYKFRNLFPVYKVTIEGNKYIYMESENKNIELMNILGFGYEGLIEDMEKINEIEQFGKYRCIIDEIDKNIPDDKIIIENII
jgi:hypothetical protein